MSRRQAVDSPAASFLAIEFAGPRRRIFSVAAAAAMEPAAAAFVLAPEAANGLHSDLESNQVAHTRGAGRALQKHLPQF
jgi:hypothetical protein